MSYQEFLPKKTSKEDYIFDTIPYAPEIDLEQLNLIQSKLQSGDALSAEETTVFLDWITYNSRHYAVSDKNFYGNISVPYIFTEPMTAQCAPTQRINVDLLRRLGLDARPFNTADCMGEIPKNQETDRRIGNGQASPEVKHSVCMVNIPIDDGNGKVVNYKFLLDPTFRQFCLKKNCIEKEEWYQHGYGAPHTGYFMQAENLMRLGVAEDEAKKTENIARYLIERGYLLLTEENTRLYMNAFRRASIDKFNQNIPHKISGYEFISNFENIPMQMNGNNKKNEYRFTRVPSEIIEEKQGIFAKIKNFFKERFGSKQKMLPSGNGMENIEIPTRENMKGVTLTPEQEEEFRSGERRILNSYGNNQNGNQIMEKEDNGIYYE